MRQYLLQRLLFMAITVFAIATLLFFMIRLAPGDPTTLLVGENLPLEDIEAQRAKWGLDEPLYQQYFSYITRLATFDFGTSFTLRKPAGPILLTSS